MPYHDMQCSFFICVAPLFFLFVFFVSPVKVFSFLHFFMSMWFSVVKMRYCNIKNIYHHLCSCGHFFKSKGSNSFSIKLEF